MHVVSAMRLVPRKRPVAALAVLRGARAILDPAVPLRATIVGEGPQRRVDGALPAHPRHGLGRAARAGRPGGAAPAAPGADAYLTTARLEAFGIAALEARAAGLPVVAPARHRGRRLRRGRRRRAARRHATCDLAGALARLAGDDALRARMRAHLLATPPAQDWPRRRSPRRSPSTAGRGCPSR